MVKLIMSGGQTGVDRAALDAALALNISYGGWCPKDRIAEDGVIPEKYKLIETESHNYSERTELNIRDSDGTLIFITSRLSIKGGTAFTLKKVIEKNKPFLLINLSHEQNQKEIVTSWIKDKKIKVLNIAGPRESQSPGIYKLTFDILLNIFNPV